jgi:hypothetical protein
MSAITSTNGVHVNGTNGNTATRSLHPLPARVPYKLTPMQKNLWAATTPEPVIAYVLARRIGKTKTNTTIYEGLRKLVVLGLIELTIDGYRRLVDPDGGALPTIKTESRRAVGSTRLALDVLCGILEALPAIIAAAKEGGQPS